MWWKVFKISWFDFILVALGLLWHCCHLCVSVTTQISECNIEIDVEDSIYTKVPYYSLLLFHSFWQQQIFATKTSKDFANNLTWTFKCKMFLHTYISVASTTLGFIAVKINIEFACIISCSSSTYSTLKTTFPFFLPFSWIFVPLGCNCKWISSTPLSA